MTGFHEKHKIGVMIIVSIHLLMAVVVLASDRKGCSVGGGVGRIGEVRCILAQVTPMRTIRAV